MNMKEGKGKEMKTVEEIAKIIATSFEGAGGWENTERLNEVGLDGYYDFIAITKELQAAGVIK